MLDTFEYKNYPHFVFEVASMDLWTVWTTPFGRTGLLEASRLHGYVHDALAGVAHLHDCDVAHGDLSLKNYLVMADHLVKVCDLGTAHTAQSLLQAEGAICTLYVRSPEALCGEVRRSDLASDAWAVGVLSLMLSTGACPFLELPGCVEASSGRLATNELKDEDHFVAICALLGTVSEAELECLQASPRRDRFLRMEGAQAARTLPQRMVRVADAAAVEAKHGAVCEGVLRWVPAARITVRAALVALREASEASSPPSAVFQMPSAGALAEEASDQTPPAIQNSTTGVGASARAFSQTSPPNSPTRAGASAEAFSQSSPATLRSPTRQDVSAAKEDAAKEAGASPEEDAVQPEAFSQAEESARAGAANARAHVAENCAWIAPTFAAAPLRG